MKEKLRTLADVQKLEEEGDVQGLIDALSDEYLDVKTEAAKTLGILADTGAVDPLAGLLTDERFEVRKSAVEALGEVGDVGAMEPLNRVIANKEEDEEIREAAKEALQKLHIVHIEGYIGPERRKHPRLKEKIPVAYKHTKTSEEVKSSTTESMSEGGVSFETDIHVSPGNVLEIQLDKSIDGEKTFPIDVKAKVIWMKQVRKGKYRLGLQFVDIDEKYRKEIIRSVEEKSGKKKEEMNSE